MVDQDGYRLWNMTALMAYCTFQGILQELEYFIKIPHDTSLTYQDPDGLEVLSGVTALHIFLHSEWRHLNDMDIRRVIWLFLSAGYGIQALTTHSPELGYLAKTPTYIALTSLRASMFFIWCEVLRAQQQNANLNIAGFARREYFSCPIYARDGWSLKALTHLLETDFSIEVRNGCQNCRTFEFQKLRDNLKERCMLHDFGSVNDTPDIEDESFLLRIGEPENMSFSWNNHDDPNDSESLDAISGDFGSLDSRSNNSDNITTEHDDSYSNVSSAVSTPSWYQCPYCNKNDCTYRVGEDLFMFGDDSDFDYNAHAESELWEGCSCSQPSCVSNEQECEYNIHHRWGHSAFHSWTRLSNQISTRSTSCIGLDLNFRVWSCMKMPCLLSSIQHLRVDYRRCDNRSWDGTYLKQDRLWQD